MDLDVASHSIFWHMQTLRHPRALAGEEVKWDGTGWLCESRAGRLPLEPGGPQGSQEDPTTHTMAESLLQVWYTQVFYTHHPMSSISSRCPISFGFECKEGVKQLQGCVDLGQIFKDPGLARERGGVILSKRSLQTPQRLPLPVPSPRSRQRLLGEAENAFLLFLALPRCH